MVLGDAYVGQLSLAPELYACLHILNRLQWLAWEVALMLLGDAYVGQFGSEP